MNNILRLAQACSLLAACTAATATPVVYLGYDATANKVVAPIALPSVAKTAFEGALSGIGAPLLREDMEGMTVPAVLSNQSPIDFSFGIITGNPITPSNEALSLASTGVFNTTSGGSKFIDASGNVTITFTEAVAGFGLYLTDLGDFSNSLITATLRIAGGGTAQVDVKSDGLNADLLFFGVYDDSSAAYSSITFNTNSLGDVFGMDDFVAVVRPVDQRIPEPGTLSMLAIGLLGLGALRRRLR